MSQISSTARLQRNQTIVTNPKPARVVQMMSAAVVRDLMNPTVAPSDGL